MDKQHGISVIEVLITILLISIGLLGLLSLQLNSLNSSHGSYLRSQATLLADDLIERIRANPPRNNPPGYIPSHTAQDYRNLYASLSSTALDCTTRPAPYCTDSPIGHGDHCNAFEMATFDFFVSYCGVALTATQNAGGIKDVLADSSVSVRCIDDMSDDMCAPNSLHEIVITWNEQAADKSKGTLSSSVAIAF